jgi:hypothetical protein
VCDEWGLYDPEQAGFAAMIRRMPSREESPVCVQASALPLVRTVSTRSL